MLVVVPSMISTFRIDFDPRHRDWLLRAHPLINHADLRFGNDSGQGGTMGLVGAIDMVLHKAKRAGGTIEIRHWDEVTIVHFHAENVPELAQMAGGVLPD